MGRCLICLLLLFSLSYAQEDIEQYLLRDSTEIAALIDTSDAGEELHVQFFSGWGISGRQFTGLSEMQSALDTLGYGTLPQTGLGWLFGYRLDIGEHMSFGFKYLSNFLVNKFTEGSTHSAKVSYFSLLFDYGYRMNIAQSHIIPTLGMGVSVTDLSLKPNGQDEITWSALHAQEQIATVLHRFDFPVSLELQLSRLFGREDKTKMLGLSLGYVFHPFGGGDLDILTEDLSFMKVTDAPPLSSSGYFLNVTWNRTSSGN